MSPLNPFYFKEVKRSLLEEAGHFNNENEDT